MNKNTWLSLAVVAAAGASSLAAATWNIDSAHSAAQFAVRHMMVSNVRGELSGIKGTAEYDPANPTQARV